MNYGSLVNLNFLGKIATFFDIIPKIIYFLFAALTAGVDAMQALIRKLAGLDTYYVSTGEAMTSKDPLTEFIYGILGIGDSAPVYKGLNTVFWSLAIFGLIVLVVSTIVAIIKSHYNEDAGETSPSKYIYTAIKSILTFAIMPVVVVLGLQLSSFVLKTLDNITSGAGSETAIKGVYGAQATEIFQGETMEGDDFKSYANYDLFGSGSPTNNSTFGGMLFKASAYSSNRARNYQVSFQNYQGLTSGGKQIFGDSSNCPEFSSLQSNAEKTEYVAMQIDYAFMNCLELQTGISYGVMTETIGDGAPYWSGSDIFGIGKSSVKAFSKYDVSAVWFFYNLWQFNFIVAFAGAITVFGIMISVILGMMTRLIKGAALFLIYPALLGIAPLDNFKAFKGWGSQFMQQIMMTFGAIVGFNLLLLIIPYVQNINFFGIAVVDSIVNLIILIAGLMMTKDFISLVAGFAGGADAASAGEGLKGSIAGGFKRGIGIAGKTGATVVKGTARATWGVGKAAVKGTIGLGKGISNLTKKVSNMKATSRANKDINKDKKQVEKKSNAAKEFENRIAAAIEAENKVKRYLDEAKAATPDKKLEEAGDKAYNKVIAKGGSKEDAQKAKDAVIQNGLLKQLGVLKDFNKQSKIAKKENAKADKYAKKHDKLDSGVITRKYNLAQGANNQMVGTYRLGKELGNTFKGTMKNIFVGKGAKDDGWFTGGMVGDARNIGKTMADGFIKAVKNGIGEGTGLDKLIGGAKDLFGDMWRTGGVKSGPFKEKPGKSEGDVLQKEIAEDQAKKFDKQSEYLASIASTMKQLTKASQDQTKTMGKVYQAVSAKNNSTPQKPEK